LTTAASLTPPPLRLPGLDPERRYRVERVALPGERWGVSRTQPSWVTGGAEFTGRQLAVAGLQPPVLNPESAVLIHLTALD
jgi:alpha-galactosidase